MSSSSSSVAVCRIFRDFLFNDGIGYLFSSLSLLKVSLLINEGGDGKKKKFFFSKKDIRRLW